MAHTCGSISPPKTPPSPTGCRARPSPRQCDRPRPGRGRRQRRRHHRCDRARRSARQRRRGGARGRRHLRARPGVRGAARARPDGSHRALAAGRRSHRPPAAGGGPAARVGAGAADRASAPRSTCCSGCPASPRPHGATPTWWPEPACSCWTRARRRPACGRWTSTPCACGGGTNHRAGLHDAVLIKDNHVAVAGGVPAAVERVRLRHPGTPGRGRGRHARPAAAGARRRRRRDPARQHAARRSCAGRWRRRPAGHAWRRPAASPSTPSARWPRPGSTRSRWERSRTRCARSTSHWRYHHQHPDRTRYRDHAGRGARAGTRAKRRDPGPQLPGRRGAGRGRLRRRLAGPVAAGGRHRRRRDRVRRRALHGRDGRHPGARTHRADPRPRGGMLAGGQHRRRGARALEAGEPRSSRCQLRQHHGRGEGAVRLLLHVGQRARHHRGGARGPRHPVPAGHVPRRLPGAADRPAHEDLAGRVPRPRRHPPAGRQPHDGGAARRPTC